MLNTTYAPSQPNSVPSSTPEMPDTSEMSRAYHREGASQLASRHADGTQCGGFSGAFDH